MIMLILLSNSIPVDLVKDLKAQKSKFIIAAKTSMKDILEANKISSDITIPEKHDYLKSLAYCNVAMIRMEYKKSIAFDSVYVFGPQFDRFTMPKTLVSLPDITSDSDLWTIAKNKNPKPVEWFFCKTPIFRLVAQAYKYAVSVFEMYSKNHNMDQIRLLSFLSQTRCNIKKI